VTIDGFRTDYRIYWTLWYSTWLHFTVHCYTHTHPLVPTVTSSLPLFCSGFQRRAFPLFWVPELSPCLSCHLLRATAHSSPEIESLTDWLLHSQSYFITGGLPPISSSRRQAPWGSQSDFLFCNWVLAVIVFVQHPLWGEDWFDSYEQASPLPSVPIAHIT
jgi:hypothetical protein